MSENIQNNKKTEETIITTKSAEVVETVEVKNNPWKEKFKKEFGIIATPIIEKFKRFLTKNPKRTFYIMISFAFLNLVLIFILSHKKDDQKEVTISEGFSKTTQKLSSNGKEEESFSLSKMMKFEKLKGRLEELKKKQYLTRADSLEFISIVEEFKQIDPDIINQVQQHRKELAIKQIEKYQSQPNPQRINESTLDSISRTIKPNDPLKADKEEIIKRQKEINNQLDQLQKSLNNH